MGDDYDWEQFGKAVDEQIEELKEENTQLKKVRAEFIERTVSEKLQTVRRNN